MIGADHAVLWGNCIAWLNKYEGVGVWAGAAASVLVGFVAVRVPFVQREIDKEKDRQAECKRVLYAARHAISALKLIDDFQHDLFERRMASNGGNNFRDWAFDFQVSEVLLRNLMLEKDREPVLAHLLVSVHAWVASAKRLIDSSVNYIGITQGKADTMLSAQQSGTDVRKFALGELQRIREHSETEMAAATKGDFTNRVVTWARQVPRLVKLSFGKKKAPPEDFQIIPAPVAAQEFAPHGGPNG